MSIGPIPRSAIKAYAEEFDVVGDAFDQFERIIRKVDNEYLAMVSASMKSATQGKGKAGTAAPADDVAAVKDVMARLGARASAAKRKH